MGYIVRKTIKKDCEILAIKLRQSDKNEIWSSHRATPIEALEQGLNESGDFCYTLLLNEEVVGIFGVNRVDNESGVVWLMGSNNMTSHKSGFYKVSKKYLRLFRKEFSLLFNYVDDRNKQTAKWLEKLGFSFIQQEPEFGEDKIPFNLFMIGR
tara:strand:- start:557 stop:1015 length:459 start_codon:yes stop_codon:yes gene_type:complete